MLKGNNNSRKKLIWLIVLIYSLRLLLCYLGYLKNYQWFDDEEYIYMLGLRFFTTHQFPWWGPDIVYTHTTLVGGMQGLLVGGPLFVWAHPFAPYFFLFIIMSSALIYLSWYISKIFTDVKPWLIYTWIAVSPFAIHTGLHVINPAYVLCFSVPFMLSFIETMDIFPVKFIKPRWRFFWMGLGVTAVFQIHGSWIVFFALFGIALLYAFYMAKQPTKILAYLAFCFLGLLVGALTLIPVLYHFGFGILSQQGKNIEFSFAHLTDMGRLVFYMLTLCGYEMNFITSAYLWDNWLHEKNIPGALLFGTIQVTGLLLFAAEILVLFWKRWRIYVIESKRFLYLISGILVLLLGVYLFTSVRPRSHMLLILFPLSALYMFWFFQNLFATTKIKYSFIVVFISLVLVYYFNMTLLTYKLPNLGLRDRAFAAIAKKDAPIFYKQRYEYPKPVR